MFHKLNIKFALKNATKNLKAFFFFNFKSLSQFKNLKAAHLTVSIHNKHYFFPQEPMSSKILQPLLEKRSLSHALNSSKMAYASIVSTASSRIEQTRRELIHEAIHTFQILSNVYKKHFRLTPSNTFNS